MSQKARMAWNLKRNAAGFQPIFLISYLHVAVLWHVPLFPKLAAVEFKVPHAHAVRTLGNRLGVLVQMTWEEARRGSQTLIRGHVDDRSTTYLFQA